MAALLIGIPADLVPNPIFGRPVPIRSIDYAIWGVTSALIGLTLAIQPAQGSSADDAHQRQTLWGGFVSFLAVGCPVCNQIVVGLLGVSGALSWWAPIQPLVGLIAIGLVLFALKKRLETYELTSCPLPAG